MGRAEKIEAEFPQGTRMPEALRRLCDYLDRTDYPLSGLTRLRPEGEFLRAWFGEEAAASQFAGFGAGPTGSILAFWLYRGPDASVAPIVHLGSEGENNAVLASGFGDFLHLLGIGYDDLGSDDLHAPPCDPNSAERFREWLLAEFGIVPPLTASALVEQARSKHPDLEAWIESWKKERRGRPVG